LAKTKVLVVGSGQAGAVKHVPAFAQCPEIEVAGVCDPDLARAQRVAREHGLAGAFTSLEEGLAATGATIISICTPPQTHRDLAIYALEHGADVLLEKPFTITLREAAEVIAAQEKTGRKLSVVHQNKFNWGRSSCLSRSAHRRSSSSPKFSPSEKWKAYRFHSSTG